VASVSEPKQLHDALFKATFSNAERAAAELRAVLPLALANRLDFSTLTLSPGTYIDPQLVGSQSDLLFRAKISGQSAFVFLLFEHQSTVDKLMAFRMLRYVVRILERYIEDVGAEQVLPLPAVIPVVLLHSATGWTASTRLGELFAPELAELPEVAPHLPQLSFLVDDLSQLTDQELEARNLGDFATLALWSLRDSRSPHRFLRSLSYWAAALQRLAVSEEAALKQIFRYLSLVVPDLMTHIIPTLLHDAAPAAEQVIMTLAEQWKAEGEARGRAEGEARGRAEGEARGLREVLVRLLVLKFGSISAEDQARIDAAAKDELLLWSERVLTADSPAAVFNG
jgi:Putative transposase, YhgA-like